MAIAQSFSSAAPNYDAAAMVCREIESRLLDRLMMIEQTPTKIVDLGCGTGSAAAQLLLKYPAASVTLIDTAEGMLSQARQRLDGYGDRCQYLRADAQQLPLEDRSVDLLFANLLLHWCADVPAVFDQIRRVLKPGGLVLFSTFGPDTLYELRASWQQVDDKPHVNRFVDMHIIGDELLRAGFADPVMDVERLSVTYSDVPAMLRELKATGSANLALDRHRGLTGARGFRQMTRIYDHNFSEADRIWASLEVVYGHAVGPAEGQPRRDGDQLVAEFSVDQLRGSRRRQ